MLMKNLRLQLLSSLAFLLLLSGIRTSAAEATVFTYQGRVTDHGTNFTGAGQFKFALVTGTNASQTATATAEPPTSGFITTIDVVSGGNGYVSPPAVTIAGGGGAGATAHALLSGGAVTSILVDNPGSGYTSTPMVTVAPPPPSITYTTYWSNDGTSVDGSEPAAAVNVSVNDGLFTVTMGDTAIPNMNTLDAALFQQAKLQLRIWFNDGVNGFAALDPAQPLTPTPYAIYGATAGLANTVADGTVSSAQLNTLTPPVNGQVLTFNGGGLVWTNPATSLSAWSLTGNAGTSAGVDFLGTTDNQPLELHVNGLRASRWEPTADTANIKVAINVIQGSPANTVVPGVQGATIAGGGANNYFGGNVANVVSDNFGTIGGGVNNEIQNSAWESTIAGGNANRIYPGAYRSTISGGWNNRIGTNSYHSVIGGGINNTVETNAYGSSIVGGENNKIGTNAIYSVIGGGSGNTASILGNFAGSGYDTIGGGSGNTASGSSGYSTVGGGYQNTAGGTYSTVSGGNGNNAAGNYSAISGGYLNHANGSGAAVAGGTGNSANGSDSFAAGAFAHADSNDSFVWGDGSIDAYDHGSNTFNALATGGYYLSGLYNQGNASTRAPVYVDSSGKLGAVSAAFVHMATSLNTINIIGEGDATKIDNALCNGKPGAILIITPAVGNGNNFYPDDHPFFLLYANYGNGAYWYIVSKGGTITVGQQFNVLVANP